MPRRRAQQRITLSDLEWPFHASRALSAVAELLVIDVALIIIITIIIRWIFIIIGDHLLVYYKSY